MNEDRPPFAFAGIGTEFNETSKPKLYLASVWAAFLTSVRPPMLSDLEVARLEHAASSALI